MILDVHHEEKFEKYMGLLVFYTTHLKQNIFEINTPLVPH
jgi:hypothetical protein